MAGPTITILTTEVIVIGWLGQLAEAAAVGAAMQLPGTEAALQLARRCGDRIKRITQTALAGLNESTREQCLHTDIAFVASTIEQHAWLSATKLALPSPEQARCYLVTGTRW